MDYKGKLYGKVGKSIFPLERTAEEVDLMEEILKDIVDAQFNPERGLHSLNAAISIAKGFLTK